jgi:serine/threonine protein kinase
MLDPNQASTGHYRGLVNQIKAAWVSGKRPDALSVLAQHPELALKKSLVVELAYEEYCQREEAGEDVDIERFCSRFTDHRTSVRRRLHVHQFIDRAESPQSPKTLWPRPPQTFCGFQLNDEIGQGAIGRVYLATQAELGGRTVVLKVSKGGSREANLLGRLEHPNVVPVYSVDTDDQTGLTTVCMPFLGLATFEDVLDQAAISSQRPKTAAIFADTVRRMGDQSRPLNSDRWARLAKLSYLEGLLVQFEQLADALTYLHAKGICHRDLKPSNILLAEDGRPMLLDFNLSADLAAADHRLGGTLPYMAPEQLQSMLRQPGKQLDARADIFAFGVILFEMLTGNLPFGPVSKNLPMERAGKLLLERQIRGPDCVALSGIGVDRQVVTIIRRCLGFDPDDRFSSAAEVAKAIRLSITPVARVKRLVRRHRMRIAVAGLLACVLLSAGAWFIATRPADYERFFAQGREQFLLGEYTAAATWFEKSKQANDDYPLAMLGLARSLQSMNEYRSALDEYQRLYEKTGDAQVLASMGYCLNMMEKHPEAISQYTRALEEGYESESVFNNLGYAYLRLTNFEKARKHFAAALEINPQCREALYNRALLEWQWATLKGGDVPPQTVTDIETAIRQGSPTANMHYFAARIWCMSKLPDHREAAIKHAQRAVDLGCDAARLKDGDVLLPLFDDPRMKDLLQVQRRRSAVPEPSPLIEPTTTTLSLSSVL